jgi:2,3-diaminopropionate biosynthesis protein SbnA
MIADRVYELITDDLFLRIPILDSQIDFYLKVEGLNPAGSIKLKTAVALVDDADSKGLLRPGGGIIESSSGNLGIALSMVCAARGYHFTCITDPKASPQSIATMRAMNANVVVVTETDYNGGYLGTRIATLKRMLALDPSLVWPNQYANSANPRAHSERTAFSIYQSVADIDYLFVGAGTTGTLMGCAAYFRQFSPRTRIVGVDTCGSVTFGRPAGPRYIPGLGTSRVPELCRSELVDELVYIEEVAAVRMCREIAVNHGLLIGGSTGSVLAAVCAMQLEIPPSARVVAIGPDLGDRYLNTVYNDEWVTERFGADALGGRELVTSLRTTGG